VCRKDAGAQPAQSLGVCSMKTLNGRSGIGIVTACLLSFAGAQPAAAQRFATLEERAAGAQEVVVATARAVNAEWRTNRFGDRLVVSRVELEVVERLKGNSGRTVWMEIDGGTVDGMTLQVSSLPRIVPGERAIFFLDSADRGTFVPHLRGQGILFLDDHDVIRGSSLRLDEIRARVRGQ
jgi:hypothetical protein